MWSEAQLKLPAFSQVVLSYAEAQVLVAPELQQVDSAWAIPAINK